MPEEENICEDAMKAVCKMASGMSLQGASHFTVNFNIKSYFHNCFVCVPLSTLYVHALLFASSTCTCIQIALPLISYLLFPSYSVVYFKNCLLQLLIRVVK